METPSEWFFTWSCHATALTHMLPSGPETEAPAGCTPSAFDAALKESVATAITAAETAAEYTRFMVTSIEGAGSNARAVRTGKFRSGSQQRFTKAICLHY